MTIALQRDRRASRFVAVIVAAAIFTIAIALAVTEPWSERGVVRGESQVMFDTTDLREIAKRSDNVFVGRVLEHRSTIRRPVAEGDKRVLPEVQYNVEVLHSVRGSVAGVVPVNAVFMDIDETSTSLDVGQEYLFATKTDGQWHTAAHSYRRVPIESPEDRTRLVADWAAAVTSLSL
ncbi:MAG TPA: hypothetical protein VF230_08900 [Acidimicrobiales bacterium]